MAPALPHLGHQAVPAGVGETGVDAEGEHVALVGTRRKSLGAPGPEPGLHPHERRPAVLALDPYLPLAALDGEIDVTGVDDARQLAQHVAGVVQPSVAGRR